MCFFERAICDQVWSSSVQHCASLRFHVLLFFLGAQPPVRFGDLELTGTKKRLPLTGISVRSSKHCFAFLLLKGMCKHKTELAATFHVGTCAIARTHRNNIGKACIFVGTIGEVIFEVSSCSNVCVSLILVWVDEARETSKK